MTIDGAVSVAGTAKDQQRCSGHCSHPKSLDIPLLRCVNDGLWHYQDRTQFAA
jgi:hypothetical protein